MQMSVFELDKRLIKMAEPLGLFGVSAHDSPSSPFSHMTSPPSVSLFMRIFHLLDRTVKVEANLCSVLQSLHILFDS